jgi:hypothetical protein
LNGVPHLLVSLLNLAVGTDIGVNNLISIKNILPDIEKGIGVSEGKNDEGRINTKNAFNILFLLFDIVAVEGTVFL